MNKNLLFLILTLMPALSLEAMNDDAEWVFVEDIEDLSWNTITKHEAHEAEQAYCAEITITKFKRLLPLNAQKHINTNPYDFESPTKALVSARESLCAYVIRADDNFESSYIKALNANFEPCPKFKPKDIYPYLGYKNAHAIHISHDVFAPLIQTKCAHAIKANNTNEQWLIRQLGLIFRNEFTKQNFDAYLTGTLNKLKVEITLEKKEALLECLNDIMEKLTTLTSLE